MQLTVIFIICILFRITNDGRNDDDLLFFIIKMYQADIR